MTPFKKGTTIIIDPNINLKDFHFGRLSSKYRNDRGIIVEVSYMQPIRQTVYRVEFDCDKRDKVESLNWFTESELVSMYEK